MLELIEKKWGAKTIEASAESVGAQCKLDMTRRLDLILTLAQILSLTAHGRSSL